jgi:MoaA/NifB/PqqE/SkfB family radical SAM enzyme
VATHDTKQDTVSGLATFKVMAEALRLPYSICDLEKVEGFTGKFGGPLQLFWTITRKCNFQCPHCFNNSGPWFPESLSPVEPILENICESHPYNVCMCGGEPLLFKGIGSITRRLRSSGIPIVSVVTNAYLATHDRLSQAFDDGINSVQISLDGVSAEDHGWYRPTPGSWEKCLNAIDAAHQIGFRSVAVSFLPNRHNIDHFAEFAALMAEHNVTQVRVQPLMSTGRASEVYDELRPTAEQTLRLQLLMRALSTVSRDRLGQDMHFEWGDPLEHIWFYTKTSAIPLQVSVEPHGWYELTPYLPFYFGDATKHSIKEVWSKGLKEIWMLPVVLAMAEKLKVLHGMREVTPRIYFDPPVLIDRFDEENWALAQESMEIEPLLAYARSKGLYERFNGGDDAGAI